MDIKLKIISIATFGTSPYDAEPTTEQLADFNETARFYLLSMFSEDIVPGIIDSLINGLDPIKRERFNTTIDFIR